MKKYLSEQLGKDYTAIGFAFHSDQYTIKGENGLIAYDALELLNSINGTLFYP
ncbi:hypothetical protein [Chryseobacterium jejuense]|uniref:hypothetical protein n=1 Tax=Chryseobacterium jejuense TaxID=445960 RepID=UPI001AEB234E|nr:hypothetical protein [Chryseobacterium jejuense]MBP2618367.1 hypothetical protein [Chryseobacterium jejuense]